MRHASILTVLLLLGACGGSADDVPTANAPEPANVAAPAPAATPAGAVPGVSGWAGTYDGTFEGGTGTVAIAEADADGRFKVNLDVGAPGCAGQAEGLAAPAGDALVLTLDRGSDDTRVCQVGITRDGDSLEIEERNCLSYHGASCSFAGTAARRGSQPAATADTPGNASR